MKKHRQFIQLPFDILKSQAYWGLNPRSRDAYSNLLAEHRPWTDIIICPRATLLLPMDGKTWNRATRQLESVGLIEILSVGGFGRRPNQYSLSDRWRKKK